MITFGCVYDIPWIFKCSYVINQHAVSGVHRLLQQASIKWWPKFDKEQVAKNDELPISPQDYNMEDYNAPQRRLKTALKGIPRNEILDFLKSNDTETMQDSDNESSSDPFSGPISHPQ